VSFQLHRYDDREGQFGSWVRSTLTGIVQPAGMGPSVRYRVKFRASVWLVPLGLAIIGVSSLAAGAYAVASGHYGVPGIYTGAVSLASSALGSVVLAREARKAGDSLETWLRDRCARSAGAAPSDSLKPASPLTRCPEDGDGGTALRGAPTPKSRLTGSLRRAS
jgi:hypothetical protein